MTTSRCIFLASFVTLACLATFAMARPDPAQLAAMADAIKYLQELDKYYSQVARPSTRSDASFSSFKLHDVSRVKQALKMLKLQELDRFYSHRARPRFGKRSEMKADPDDAMAMEQNAGDLGDDARRIWSQIIRSR